ncbi:MAG TPA: TetR/AcrR family transcriptional regulator [Gemmatimonadaceae bacterium]|nr:TetR/AcrR family transcriptional regulator [Gemmatimonadaceae bacterium]
MTRGRPREFDTDTALDQALQLFARDGFVQASVQDLADSMGICKPSLYAAYGNKEALFIEALRRYAAAGDARRSALLDGEPDGERAVMRLLEDAAQSFTTCDSARGCMLVAEASSQAARSTAIREALAAAMQEGNAMLCRRLQRAVHDGHLAPDTDIDAMTGYLGALMAGLSVMARNGASTEQLRSMVQTAMRAWQRPVLQTATTR